MVKQTRAGILIELVLALGVLATVVIPLSYSFVFEQRQCRAAYERAVLMERVDGEMEVLVAGEWRRYGDGAHHLPHNLTLTVTGQKLRLQSGPIVREGTGR